MMISKIIAKLIGTSSPNVRKFHASFVNYTFFAKFVSYGRSYDTSTTRVYNHKLDAVLYRTVAATTLFLCVSLISTAGHAEEREMYTATQGWHESRDLARMAPCPQGTCPSAIYRAEDFAYVSPYLAADARFDDITGEPKGTGLLDRFSCKGKRVIAGETITTSESGNISCFKYENGIKVGAYPGECLGQCTFHSDGNPIGVYDGIKTETSSDWVSPIDDRFKFVRTYVSENNRLGVGIAQSYGLNWQGNWAKRIKFDQDGSESELDVHVLEGKGTTTHRFVDGGPYDSGHPYRIEIVPSTPLELVVTDGSGMKWHYEDVAINTFEFQMNFERTSNNGTGSFLYEMTKVSWPDGYTVELDYDVDGFLQFVTDNKGQRAKYTWTETGDTGSDEFAVYRIRIDTDFVTGSFAPDVRLEYSYTPDTPAEESWVIREVSIEDLATAAQERLWAYDYRAYDPLTDLGPSVSSLFTQRTNLLTNVYRGATDGFGADIAYSSFTYDNNRRATVSEHAGGADRVEISVDGDERIVTNPLGLETHFSYADSDLGPKIAESRYLASPGCDPATETCDWIVETRDYTPTSSGAEGYLYGRTKERGTVGTGDDVTTTYQRDADGLVTSMIEDDAGADERTTDYDWDTSLRLPENYDTSLLHMEFTYNSDGQILTSSQEDIVATSPNFGDIRTTTNTYTTHATGMRLLSSVDGPGVAPGVVDITVYGYDSVNGLLETVTDPEGLVTEILSRDAFGNPKRIEASNEVVWEFEYDVRGHLLSTTRDPDGTPVTTASFTYDAAGNMTSVTNAKSNTWTYDYDPANRLTRITAPDGDVIDYVHDAMGNVTSTTYAAVAGGSNTFALTTDFDELGRILRTIGGNGQTTEFAHDADNNLTVTTDPGSSTSTNIYDRLNRLVALEDQASNQTDLVLDDADQLTSHTDARSIETTFTYNGFGDMVAEDSPDRGARSYTYDMRGLTTSMTDPRSITTNFEYDNAGRLTAEIHPANTSENITYTYDVSTLAGFEYNKGQLGEITDESGSTETRFRMNGMPVEQRRTIGVQAYDIGYGFTDADELSWIDYPSGRRVSYTYNSSGEITRVRTRATPSDPWEIIVKLGTYEPNGPLVSMEFGDGFTQTRSYDNSYRLTGILDSDGITTLRDLDYGYNGRDLLTSITDQLDSNQDEDFTYISRGMLKTADAPGTYGFLDYY